MDRSHVCKTLLRASATYWGSNRVLSPFPRVAYSISARLRCKGISSRVQLLTLKMIANNKRYARVHFHRIDNERSDVKDPLRCFVTRIYIISREILHIIPIFEKFIFCTKNDSRLFTRKYKSKIIECNYFTYLLENVTWNIIGRTLWRMYKSGKDHYT